MTTEQASMETVSDDACTNILVGYADENWLLFYMGGQTSILSPYTDMEKLDQTRIYLTPFDTWKCSTESSNNVDVRRLAYYGSGQRPFGRWIAEVAHGYRLSDLASFTCNDTLEYNGVQVQLLAERTDGPLPWKLTYRSNAANGFQGEHESMMSTFFSAIDGSTLEIIKLESPIPAWNHAGETAQLSNCHGGVVVGYDERAFKAICEYARSHGMQLDPYGYGSDDHSCVWGDRKNERQLPSNWPQNVRP